MKTIKLLNLNKTLLVDDEDFERVNQFKWYICGDTRAIKADIYGQTTSIGRFILNYSGLLEIDHKDRNKFNCQKENLREATKSQNCANRKLNSNNTSGYKGVSWHQGAKKWLVYITVNNNRKYLGGFIKKEEAAQVYNNAALKFFGDFAVLNQIE